MPETTAVPATGKRVLLGVGISPTSYNEILALCRAWVQRRRAWLSAGAPPEHALPARMVAFLTVHSVTSAVIEKSLRPSLNSADIAAPDGVPVVWALRSLGVRRQPRVYGPDTMLAVCAQAGRLGHRIFLYGARQETLNILRARLQAGFPGLQIAGAFAPPFRPPTPEMDADHLRRIKDSGADIVFVGMSATKQERWVAAHREDLPGVVLFAVGAAFDFHSGRVRQAPPWMQRNGLEWLFRLAMEPKRLWKRYVLLNPLFLVLWALQAAGILRYPPLAPEETR